ncbi:MAG: carboxypeptidase regulatory-like domain-containing protein [candidate division Zixibacteria bacterium]|nr:carboxypeptidase regulatory-like domain-containing protein [candidate division Zixibacteria bacterium]
MENLKVRVVMIMINAMIKISGKSKKAIPVPVFLAILFFFCSSLSVAYAGSTGTITGTVIDSDDKQPVPGAKVRIMNTNLRAMVNVVDGSYEISSIPPGEYTILAECLGYNEYKITDVNVIAGSTVEINYLLKSKWKFHGHKCIASERLEIDKRETSSVVRMSTKEIEWLPVTNIQGILKAQ